MLFVARGDNPGPTGAVTSGVGNWVGWLRAYGFACPLVWGTRWGVGGVGEYG